MLLCVNVLKSIYGTFYGASGAICATSFCFLRHIGDYVQLFTLRYNYSNCFNDLYHDFKGSLLVSDYK